VGGREQLRAAGDAALDEVDEQRAGAGVQLDVRGGGERIVIGQRRRRRLRADDTDVPTSRGGDVAGL
jgi:hypothetical protein